MVQVVVAYCCYYWCSVVASTIRFMLLCCGVYGSMAVMCVELGFTNNYHDDTRTSKCDSDSETVYCTRTSKRTVRLQNIYHGE